MALLTRYSFAGFIATILAILMACAMQDVRHMRSADGIVTLSGATGQDPLRPAGTMNEYKILDYWYDPEIHSWTYRPSAPAQKHTHDEYRDFAFVLKKTQPHSSWYTNTVTIKSKILRDVCAEVIGVIPPVSFHTGEVDVNPKVLLIFYPALLNHLENLGLKGEKSGTKVAQLSLLLDFLRTEYANELDELASHLEHGKITFNLLWAILVPNREYYTIDSRTGQPRAVILKWATEERSWSGTYFDLDCEYLESFGNSPDDKTLDKEQHRFGRATYRGVINEFQGAVNITSLNIFPMDYHPRIDEVRKLLISRGKKWAAYDGKHHISYTGIAFQEAGFGGTRRVYIDGRAMVDKATFRRIRPNWHTMKLPVKFWELDADRDGYKEDNYWYGSQRDDPMIQRPQTLTDDELVLATPIVYGFALDDHQWCEFNIDLIEEITWNKAAFANLVLPEEKKSLVNALVDAHSERDPVGVDDFIIGKGRGLVINLFGPPGVGKTMSAEAISEHLRRPLYVVGAGHLGTSAPALDKSLNEIFDIAHAWKAVILIDEADIFLEERSIHDIHRNALVAVFLRQLEYFAGILFLTTNRVTTFDHAFQSRIHIALRYPDLDRDARLTIWKAFLTKNGAGTSISDKEWESLVRKKVNGRQIKNAVNTAKALAHSKRENLNFAHLNQVLSAMDQFDTDTQLTAK